MLRGLVLVFGLVGLAGGFLALLSGIFPVGTTLTVLGATILIGTLYERTHYKIVESVPQDEAWVKTVERFIDHDTGKPITVYLNPASGERKYVQQ